MEVSFGELVLIGLIAFLVLGPKEMVLRANQLGRWLNKMRAEVNSFKAMAQEQILKEDYLKDSVKRIPNWLEPKIEPKKVSKGPDSDGDDGKA